MKSRVLPRSLSAVSEVPTREDLLFRRAVYGRFRYSDLKEAARRISERMDSRGHKANPTSDQENVPRTAWMRDQYARSLMNCHAHLPTRLPRGLREKG